MTQDNVVKKPQNYLITRWWKIILVRFFDIVFSSILPLVLSLTFKTWSTTFSNNAILLFFASLIWLVIYFLIIPCLCQGRTMGKLLFRIKVIQSKSNLKICYILSRELFIIFVPWTIQLIVNLSFYLGFNLSINDIFANSQNDVPSWVYLIYRLVIIFYLAWYIILILVIWVDPKNQFFLDHKFKIYLVDFSKKKSFKQKTKEDDLIKRKDTHVHLGKDQPGNIDDEVLKEIEDL